MLRNTAPDTDLGPDEQLQTMVRLFVEQVVRRRGFYLSLLHGTGGGDVAAVEVYDGIRDVTATRVTHALRLAPGARTVVHAWWSYVEDRALSWSGEPTDRRTTTVEGLVGHCVTALHALLALDQSPIGQD